MGLADELNAVVTRSVGPCGFGKILLTISLDELEALERVFASGVSPERVAALLKRNGHAVSASTIRRHRNKSCSCESAS